jgi:hypothetical protein
LPSQPRASAKSRATEGFSQNISIQAAFNTLQAVLVIPDYFIFVKSFYNTDRVRNGTGTVKQSYYGGSGIIQQLNH